MPVQPWVYPSWCDHSCLLPLVPEAASQISWTPSFFCQAVSVSHDGQQLSFEIILLSHRYGFTTPDPMTLTLLNLSKIVTGRPIVNRPGHPVIIPTDVRSVRGPCRIILLKASCKRKSRTLKPIGKKMPSSQNKNFWQLY